MFTPIDTKGKKTKKQKTFIFIFLFGKYLLEVKGSLVQLP